MANNLNSNVTRKVLRKFLPSFDSSLVLTKGVSRDIIGDGDFTPASGSTVDVKRPHDYTSYSSSDGDLTSSTASPLVAGKATATVQNWRTVWTEWSRLEKALQLDQLGKPGDLNSILGPMASRLATDVERDFASYVSKNAGLLAGDYGTAVTTWDHVAEAGAVMQANGVPMDDMWSYYMNPFTQRKLASGQKALGNGPDGLVDDAYKKAMITQNFAGLDVFTCNTLPSYTTGAGADRVGAIASNPDVTYVTAKDTMTQSIAVSGFQANLEVKAGEVVKITGRYALDKSTRDPVIDDSGARVEFTAVVTEDVTLSGTGTGTLVVSGPAIYEASGAYNTVDSAPVATDVITLLGSASTLYQPNLFWHKKAFGLQFVNLPKLATMENSVVNVDGMSIRVALDGNLIQNKEVLRIDVLPAYATYNPFMAGKSFGF